MKGTVKWWNDNKGYGFVAYPGNEEIGAFTHYTAIMCDGFKTLTEGETIEFELLEGPKGPQAVNVKRGAI